MRIFLSLALLACATGCATAPASASRDPFEGFNRSVFQFNEKLDQSVVKPVAETYQQITPQPVQTGVKNFFGNLSDVWSTVNNALQLKPVPAAESFMRVLVNSTVGLYGVLDKQLAEHRYIAGDEYTIADIAAFPWTRSWKNQGIDWADYPNAKRWHDEVAARPAVQRGVEVLASLRKPLVDDKAREMLFGSAQYQRH